MSADNCQTAPNIDYLQHWFLLNPIKEHSTLPILYDQLWRCFAD